jgi:S-DNA-T family DNA segregation ATPase FtsK/SpoIIIE
VVEVQRDLGDDLDEVLPETGRVPAGDVLGALRNLAPKWKVYAEFTVPTFVAALGEMGIKVPRTGNKNLVDPVTVREVLAQRDGAVGEE